MKKKISLLFPRCYIEKHSLDQRGVARKFFADKCPLINSMVVDRGIKISVLQLREHVGLDMFVDILEDELYGFKVLVLIPTSAMPDILRRTNKIDLLLATVAVSKKSGQFMLVVPGDLIVDDDGSLVPAENNSDLMEFISRI